MTLAPGQSATAQLRIVDALNYPACVRATTKTLSVAPVQATVTAN